MMVLGLICIALIAAAIRVTWVLGTYRGWNRGFQTAEAIWKKGFYELIELQRKRV